VLKEQGFPVSLDVASFAGFAEPACMLVVFLVARMAVGRRLVLVERTGVAIVASRLPVITFQRVGGVAIVLKEQGFPSPLGVAAFARFTEAACMLVVLLMARIAVGRRPLLIEMALVARGTFRRDVMSP